MRIDISLSAPSAINCSVPNGATLRVVERSTTASGKCVSMALMIAVIATLGFFTTACTPSEDVRLIASGELLEADGRTPIGDTLIERYQLTFSFESDGGGEVNISRGFIADGDGRSIVTDANGIFEITSTDLALSYDWQRDEYVCEDVCVTWDTVCNDVSEEVCDVCTETECWDDCSEECTVECWDEKVCDDSGCWVETVCEDDCYDVCQTVCEPVDYDCNCRWETYEECDDVCTLSTTECEWLTRTYTSYPTLAEVKATQATVWTQDTDGSRRTIVGETPRQQPRSTCASQDKCDSNVWRQQDQFIMPAAKLTPPSPGSQRETAAHWKLSE